MPYKNDLSEELEREAADDPASAAPKLLDLVFRLLLERHAYRLVLEAVAYNKACSFTTFQERAKDACEEFVKGIEYGRRL